MSIVHVCLELDSGSGSSGGVPFYDECYQKVFKPFLTFLYSHPKFPLTVSFTGEQLSYYEEKYPEAIQILRELTSRHQVEVLGGGYYSPIFPLLFPVDRSGQIEKMSALLRATVGKRPRGMTLFGSIWDPSLVTTFQSCGMEYVLLDSTLVPSSCKCCYPLITSEQGKTLKVLPLRSDFLPLSGEKGEEWVARIQQAIRKECDSGENGFDPVAVISIPVERGQEFLRSECFKYIYTLVEDSSQCQVRFDLPQLYLKAARRFTPAYVPAGMERNVSQWARTVYEKCENKSRFPVTIYDFLNTYRQNRRLYERMMYISMIIAQCHGGDKQRKRFAQEKLWEAQCGFNYVTLPLGLPAIAGKRQSAYRLLNEAEKIVRDSYAFSESLTNFDYNGDGLNEYICQMEKFHAVISPLSGQVSELDIIGASANYAASLSRIQQFDKVTDAYSRGLFVEHLFEPQDIQNYFSQKPSGTGIFSQVLFTEKKFDCRRREIQMEGRGTFSSLHLPVTLRKNFIISSSGFSVQYILKNESPFPLKGVLVVEANFAQTQFDREIQQYSSELILKGSKKTVPADSSYTADSGVSLIQVVDNADRISFLFEPNEACGFSCADIPFRRLDCENKLREVSRTFVVSLFWAVDLAADRAMEKTVNLSIMPVKMQAKKKSAEQAAKNQPSAKK